MGRSIVVSSVARGTATVAGLAVAAGIFANRSRKGSIAMVGECLHLPEVFIAQDSVFLWYNITLFLDITDIVINTDLTVVSQLMTKNTQSGCARVRNQTF